MDRVSVFIVGLCLAGMVSGEHVRISAVIGGNVTLPCEAKERFKLVEWSRPTGGNPEYILVFRHNKTNQTPERYQGRVEFKDLQNGDASLVLKNVMAEDNGTYECYVQKASNRRKRAIDPVSTVYLDVRHPSPPDVPPPPPPHVPPPSHGKIGLIVGLAVFALIVAAVAAFVVRRSRDPLLLLLITKLRSLSRSNQLL